MSKANGQSPQEEPISPHYPTTREMVMLPVPEQVRVSPGGRYIAILLRTTNWRENRYERICQIYDPAGDITHPLTRTGDVLQAEWLDDHSLALLVEEKGKKSRRQIWLWENLMGEGWVVTDHGSGVEWFYPFRAGLLYRARHPQREARKARKARFGEFIHFEQEESTAALYYVGLEELRRHRERVKHTSEEEGKDLTPPVLELSRLFDEPLSIQQVVASEAESALYISGRVRDDLVYLRETRVYRIQVDPRRALAVQRQKGAKQKGSADDGRQEGNEDDGDLSHLGDIVELNLPAGAGVAAVAPDGRQLLLTHRGRDEKLYSRQDLWLLEVDAALQAAEAAEALAHMRNISAVLNRKILDVQWREEGIFAAYVEGTTVRIAHLDGAGGVAPLDLGEIGLGEGFHICDRGDIALVGASATTFPEVYLVEPGPAGERPQPRQITGYGRALEGWSVGRVETIRWTSADGTEIEGVLRLPDDFDPARRYPLALVVHGGPDWFSASYLLTREDRSYYPTLQLVNQDILVLKPNYRGSAGYGQAFTELNVDNLGVGDLWDLESGVEHLVEKGWVDPARVGCMGWSQGGYISAFAGLHSERFAAVSVGAGISDWYTYHVSNDIPQFTTDYLSGSPFRDRSLYHKTAPIRNLANARTPTLIQHGADDRRVPLSNAMELYRGLQEMGVPVELYVFPDMGHPITRPRENHAVMEQNLIWFRHYLLGAPLTLDEIA